MSRIAHDPALRSLPVVVLTTSAEDRDIGRMYDERCSSYIVKSLDFELFSRTIGQLAAYWFGCVVLPPRDGRG
jgi:CheY-like chemotaxis protein